MRVMRTHCSPRCVSPRACVAARRTGRRAIGRIQGRIKCASRGTTPHARARARRPLERIGAASENVASLRRAFSNDGKSWLAHASTQVLLRVFARIRAGPWRACHSPAFATIETLGPVRCSDAPGVLSRSGAASRGTPAVVWTRRDREPLTNARRVARGWRMNLRKVRWCAASGALVLTALACNTGSDEREESTASTSSAV